MSRYHRITAALDNHHKVSRSLTPSHREMVKDWKLKKQRESNEVPPFEKVLEVLKASDGWANEVENAEMLGRGQGFDEGSPEWEEAVEDELTGELKGRYDGILWEMDNLDGEDCWRVITLREDIDPRNLAGVGEYWAQDPGAAEAHWGRFSRGMQAVLLRARIDSDNIDKAGMMYARSDLDIGEQEKEVRFLKHAPSWVYDAKLEDGTVVEINGWRRT